MAFQIKAAGERMRRRNIDAGERIFDELDALDGARSVGADCRDPYAWLPRQERRQVLKLCRKVIVDEQDVHFFRAGSVSDRAGKERESGNQASDGH